MFKIIEKSKIWFSISLAIILIGVVLMFTRGLNFGIDFKGRKFIHDLAHRFWELAELYEVKNLG